MESYYLKELQLVVKLFWKSYTGTKQNQDNNESYLSASSQY